MTFHQILKHEASNFVQNHFVQAVAHCPRKRLMISVYFAVMCLAVLLNILITKRPIGLGNLVFYLGLFAGVSTRGLLLDVVDKAVATTCALAMAMFFTMMSFCLYILF